MRLWINEFRINVTSLILPDEIAIFDSMSRLANSIRKLGEKDNFVMKWGIVILFVLIVASLFPTGESIESDYHVGVIWTDHDLIAPFSFPIYRDEREYEKERELAASKVYRVFQMNSVVAQIAIDSLNGFFVSLESALNVRARYFHRRELASRRKNVRVREDSALALAAMRGLPVNFTDSEWGTLQKLRLADAKRKSPFALKGLQRDVLLVVNELYLQGIVNVRKTQFGNDQQIAFRKKTDEQIVPLSKFLDQEDLGRTVQQIYATGYKQKEDVVDIATKVALSFLKPNVMFDREQTEKEIAVAVDQVPRTMGVVQENERIISKHERVTVEIKLRLDSLRKAKAERGADIDLFTTFVGKFFHVFTIIWLFGIYLYLFRKKTFHDNAKILLIALVVLLEALFAYLTLTIDVEAPIELLIVVPSASMLLAIIFDSRLAFYLTVVMSFVVAGIRGNDYSIALYSLVAGSLAVYTVRDIKHRTQIFRSIIFIFIAYVVSIVALSLERYENIFTIANQIMYAGINAVFSPVLTYGLLIFFEKFFHVTTDLTLLELSDFNNHLLKELSQKAPGSFHHSVNLGTLAESAAEAIGANAILARVGAYYHDIGKITKPSMFVENQLGRTNRHEKLNPYVSAKVIASHVKDGVAVGREYGIPDVILDFIPMHHGTTMIGFFFEQALRKKGKNEVVNQNDFRYPGPRPQTKETAIVMLADAVEAATRSIEEPTIQKIEERIDAIIKSRFMEGELDECELTLRDLTRIKASFLKILTGIHHSRIRYPEQGEKPDIEPESPPVRKIPKSADKRLQRRIHAIDKS